MFEVTPENFLALPNSLLVGSRAFDVHEENADYDICVLNEELPEIIPNAKYFKGASCFAVVPKSGLKLLRFAKTHVDPGLDILIFFSKGDLKKVADVVDQMYQIPRYMLFIKNIRVNVFEELLLTKGFEHTRKLRSPIRGRRPDTVIYDDMVNVNISDEDQAKQTEAFIEMMKNEQDSKAQVTAAKVLMKEQEYKRKLSEMELEKQKVEMSWEGMQEGDYPGDTEELYSKVKNP